MKYLTIVDSVNTFNLKNHQVLRLKFLSTKQWQRIYSRGSPTGPPTVQSLGFKVAMGSVGQTSGCQYIIKICLNLTFHMVSRVAS